MSETYAQWHNDSGRKLLGKGHPGMSQKNEIVLDHTGYVGHGNTPAAWTCVAFLTLGVVVAVAGFTIQVPPVLWIGLALCVVGLMVGFVMKRMGLGYEGAAARAAENGGHAH